MGPRPRNSTFGSGYSLPNLYEGPLERSKCFPNGLDRLLIAILVWNEDLLRGCRIQQAGRRRCLNDHTWEKRFERVFRQIGLSER
jgi:hypothetical protein